MKMTVMISKGITRFNLSSPARVLVLGVPVYSAS